MSRRPKKSDEERISDYIAQCVQTNNWVRTCIYDQVHAGIRTPDEAQAFLRVLPIIPNQAQARRILNLK